MSFFKTATQVRESSINTFYRISTDFCLEYYREHESFKRHCLNDSISRNRVLQSSQENAEVRHSIISKGDSSPDSSKSFTRITAKDSDIKNSDLKFSLMFENNISIFDESFGQTQDLNSHIFDGHTNTGLQKQFLRKNLLHFYFLIESSGNNNIVYKSKAIDVKKFDTKEDYDLNIFLGESKIVYKTTRITTVNAVDFTLKKTTENVYNIPLLTPDTYIDEETMFKILINSPQFSQFERWLVDITIDYKKVRREDYPIIRYDFYKAISKYIYTLGKFKTKKDFFIFCEKSDRVNDFLEACLEFSSQKISYRTYEDYPIKTKYYTNSRYKDDLYGL